MGLDDRFFQLAERILRALRMLPRFDRSVTTGYRPQAPPQNLSPNGAYFVLEGGGLRIRVYAPRFPRIALAISGVITAALIAVTAVVALRLGRDGGPWAIAAPILCGAVLLVLLVPIWFAPLHMNAVEASLGDVLVIEAKTGCVVFPRLGATVPIGSIQRVEDVFFYVQFSGAAGSDRLWYHDLVVASRGESDQLEYRLLAKNPGPRSLGPGLREFWVFPTCAF
jgi:hypothetical protein